MSHPIKWHYPISGTQYNFILFLHRSVQLCVKTNTKLGYCVQQELMCPASKLTLGLCCMNPGCWCPSLLYLCCIMQWKTCNSKQGMNLQPFDLLWSTYHIPLHKNKICLHKNGVIHSALLIQKCNACGIFYINLESKLSSLSIIPIIQNLKIPL